MRSFQEIKSQKTVRDWYTWKLKLVDARFYLVSMVVRLLTGLIAVPYRYQLYYLSHVHSGLFVFRPVWYWHIPLFMLFWGILILVSRLVDKMPLIGDGDTPQTRGAISGRMAYRHPFIELTSEFAGGILSVSVGLSLGREGPSVQMGSYVGCLVPRWTRILKDERKQLLAAGAGTGPVATFTAPLASSLIVIESIGCLDAPKTTITTPLASAVTGVVAILVFPINPYHLTEVSESALAFWVQVKYPLISAVTASVVSKLYAATVISPKRICSAVKSLTSVKMFHLVSVACIILLMQINLTGSGEQFPLEQAQNGSTEMVRMLAVMLLYLGSSVCSVSSGLPGGNLIPTLATGGLLGRPVGLITMKYGIIGQESVTYVMLTSVSAFLVATERTPLTAIILITEIAGHFEIFYPSVVVDGFTYYFTELLQIKSFNVILHEDMVSSSDFQKGEQCALSTEVVTSFYLDGKAVGELSLPEHCVIIDVHRDGKDLIPAETNLTPGGQVQIEMDPQNTEKLYEPPASVADIY